MSETETPGRSATPPSTPRRIGQLVAPGYVHGEDPSAANRGLAAALLRYRIMAYIVGVGLLILVFVGVPLQYAATIPQVAQIVGPIHGFLYIVYLLAAVDLARRARFTLLQMAAMVGAGFLPFLAFVIERRVGRRVERLMADDALPG
jgi:integral membrane protein